MAKLSHPNLVKLHTAWVDIPSSSLYIVMSLAGMGSLYEWIHVKRASNLCLNLFDKVTIARDIASGTSFCSCY